MNHEIVYKRVKDAITILPPRYQRVVCMRYGIDNDEHTLEEIGDEFGITRERVRQIEVKALVDLAKEKNPTLLPCYRWLLEAIEREGGVVAEHQFLDFYGREKQGALLLVLWAGEGFLRGTGNDEIHHHWYLNEGIRAKALKEVEMVTNYIRQKNRLIKREEIDFHLSRPNFLTLSRIIGLSPLGLYGFTYWPEVVPKGVKDKAYIVLKMAGKPLHFVEITDCINQLKLGKRKALKQTVHNELIKDPRFVLVGRGLYALKEWGYQAGTVKDILERIFTKAGKPLTKKEVFSQVLKERLVQKNTILLNLNNKRYFERLEDGIYMLKTKK